MKIKPFAVEEWMNKYENGAKYNIAETCVDSISLDELFALTKEDKEKVLNDFASKRLTYGDITGSSTLLEGISKLYRTIGKDEIVLTHGAAGANHHVFVSLVSPSDHVISIMPTYQQLYSIPESIGADLDVMKLKEENGYLPDLEELERLLRKDTKLIVLNNPNNPTGALMPQSMLHEIVSMAKSVDAYLFVDEVYRHLTQEDIWSESVADIYSKGISTSSMSKVFSLAGIRMGWIATHDKTALDAFFSHRDYDLISCGMFDDMVASICLRHSDVILNRNKNIVRENLAILDKWIEENPHFRYIKPDAGTTALIRYDFSIPSFEFAKTLYDKTGAFVTPGSCFGEERCFRIGYGCDREVLIKGLDALSKFADSLS